MADNPVQPELPAQPDTSFSRRLKDRITALPGLRVIKGGGLKAMALKGSAWTVAGYGASQVLRLGSNLILTRLLFPEAFGLMALVSVFMTGLQMFSDVGIGPSIIQNARGDDPKFLNTAWTIQIVRGFVLWLFACLIAWPVSLLYGEPELALLLPVVGVTATISGFQTTAVHTTNRQLQLGRVTLLQLIGQLVTIVVMVAWAWVSPTVWSLIAGGILGSTTSVVIGHWLLPSHQHRLSIEKESLKSLLGYGKWIAISTVATYAGGQGLQLIRGLFVAIDLLGQITIAMMLCTVIRTIVELLQAKIFFPVLSKVQNDSQRYIHSTRLGRYTATAISLPILGMTAFLGDTITDFLYDPRYILIGDFIAPAAAASILDIVCGTYLTALLAAGDSRAVAMAQILRSLFRVVATCIGYAMAGPIGMIWGLAAGSIALYPYVLLHAISIKVDDRLLDILSICTVVCILFLA
ncbi:oligosaccharide flippase family protein [Mucisphaera sp.]|uniref:oligosaccharide flippase family protein n=1 Tax=Mucisphaera sp. TaxID=2913024 RepID=UPI003D0A7538